VTYKKEIFIVTIVALCTALLIILLKLSVGWGFLFIFLASISLVIYIGYRRNKLYELGKTNLCKDCDHFIKETELCNKFPGRIDYVNGNPTGLYHAETIREFMYCGENGKFWTPKKNKEV
jgi:hypothetical protein